MINQSTYRNSQIGKLLSLNRVRNVTEIVRKYEECESAVVLEEQVVELHKLKFGGKSAVKRHEYVVGEKVLTKRTLAKVMQNVFGRERVIIFLLRSLAAGLEIEWTLLFTYARFLGISKTIFARGSTFLPQDIMSNIVTCFIVLGTGLSIGITVLVFEITTHRRSCRKLN